MARRLASGPAVCGSLARFLPCRGGEWDRRPSPEACLSRRPGAVPAVPAWNSAPQTQAWRVSGEYSCCAGIQRREAFGHCVFLLRRAESRERCYRTSWWLGAFLFLLCRGEEEKREVDGCCGYPFLLCQAENRERQCQTFQLL